jgi:hypothetical protein
MHRFFLIAALLLIAAVPARAENAKIVIGSVPSPTADKIKTIADLKGHSFAEALPTASSNTRRARRSRRRACT